MEREAQHGACDLHTDKDLNTQWWGWYKVIKLQDRPVHNRALSVYHFIPTPQVDFRYAWNVTYVFIYAIINFVYYNNSTFK